MKVDNVLAPLGAFWMFYDGPASQNQCSEQDYGTKPLAAGV
jgi:hypothetical protein